MHELERVNFSAFLFIFSVSGTRASRGACFSGDPVALGKFRLSWGVTLLAFARSVCPARGSVSRAFLALPYVQFPKAFLGMFSDCSLLPTI